jgi:uncharacterized protein
MEQVIIYVETEINPTEDEDKVKFAVNNVLGNSVKSIKSAQKGNTLIAQAEGQDSLIRLRSILRNDRIRDAARRILFRSTRGNRIVFCLNKQVAFAGHISFCEENAESPLGPIRFTIETDQPQQLIEWLAEKTD